MSFFFDDKHLIHSFTYISNLHLSNKHMLVDHMIVYNVCSKVLIEVIAYDELMSFTYLIWIYSLDLIGYPISQAQAALQMS